MIRSLISPIMIVLAAIVFFGPTRSTLKSIEPLTERRMSLEQALTSAQKIQSVRESLQSSYNSFKGSDLARLQKLLPPHVDNVRLVIDINGIAEAYGMTLRNIEIEQNKDKDGEGAPPTVKNGKPEHLGIRFTLSGGYESFKQFLGDLGKSLRIVDIGDISFQAKEEDYYDFSVHLRTYWLQDK
ncbi:MAG: hypothetical protein A2749_01195 [Parcubacteria group bacterium RIFCSPHIGHO2_01_FULL_45_26]|nr:MAG: hypothetical protein A2749_01195 [Parcubacteria group bacterium RIFCSPHIGHO2_01_FULL_45_26]